MFIRINFRLFHDRTAVREVIRLLIHMLVQREWRAHSIDCKTAFLQADELRREIFVWPPREESEDARNGVVYRLLRPLYGLVDAPLL